MLNRQASPTPLFISRRPAAAVAALLLTVLFGFGAEAQAQLTPKALIGDSVSNPDDPQYSDIAAAIKTYENRDVLAAKSLLETAKRKNSKLPPVGVMLAKMHMASNNSAAVRPSLEVSIDEDANDPEPYVLLAESNLRANHTIEADALFDKSTRLIESYTANAKRKRLLTIRAYRGQAAVAQRRKNWAQAENALRVWLREDPDDAAAHASLGQVLCMLDRVDEGRKEFEAAKKLDEKRPSPYVLTAIMYERRGMKAQAMNEYKKAYSQDKSEQTSISFAQALIRDGKLNEAGKVLNAARQSSPGSFNIWLLSGVTARMLGSEAAAERAFLEALKISPGNRDVYDQLAQILVAQDDKDKKARALQYAQTNAKLYPDNNDVKVSLAWVFYQTGRSTQAQAALRSALQSGSGALSADSRYLVARVLRDINQIDNARKLLTSALANNEGIFVQRTEAEKLLASLN